jgi:NAD(P)-dependent dehydrogenase (short-subunit alcohol dehydrogenase family)
VMAMGLMTAIIAGAPQGIGRLYASGWAREGAAVRRLSSD